MLVVLDTICIDVVVVHVLAAKCADQVELLELTSVPVDQLGPLIHFVPRFFVKLILEVIVLFLQLLRELVDDIIFELEQLSLLLVVLHQHLSLGEFSWQVIWVHIDVYFELLGHGILQIFI